jgi:menaquinone-dependent protoporphyrinogen oxidase
MATRSLLIAYATREGHARRIAEHLHEHLGARVSAIEVCDCARAEWLHPNAYSAVILIASVHNRQHEPEAIRFARRVALANDNPRTAFVSVSSVQMLAESAQAPARLRALARRGAQELIAGFLRDSGLRPQCTLGASGALMYTQYRLMQRIGFALFARIGGLSTDTSRDHVYTDWSALERFADDFVARLESTESSSPTESRESL